MRWIWVRMASVAWLLGCLVLPRMSSLANSAPQTSGLRDTDKTCWTCRQGLELPQSPLANGASNGHVLAAFYVIPNNISYEDSVHQQLVRSTRDVQAWYQIASGGFTWEFAYPETVRVYYADQTWQYYRDHGNWWGSLLGEMGDTGLPIWSPGTIAAIWARGAGWWAGAAQFCEAECGVALLGVSLFPRLNNAVYSGGECPPGQGVVAWPCTPEGAYAHELGHTLGLSHPDGNPATQPYAPHSVMQTHWNFPVFAPPSEQPWGFLRPERQTIRSNPFMKGDIDLVQVYPAADVVNLPPPNSIPIAEFTVQTSGRQITLFNASTGATHYYWTFGDGRVSNEVSPGHVYEESGVYTISLRASDDSCSMGFDSMDVSIDTVVSAVEDLPRIDSGLGLAQNRPNPFNATTAIMFRIPKSGNVRLAVYNSRGSWVADLVRGFRDVGVHVVTWEADRYPTGVYFYRLEFEGDHLSRKLILLK